MSGEENSNGSANTQQNENQTKTEGKYYTQEELNAKFAERAERAEAAALEKISAKYGDLDSLASAKAELEKIQDSQKTNEQKLLDRIASLEATDKQKEEKIADLTFDKERIKFANTKSIPEKAVAHCKSVEEMEEIAKDLLDWHGGSSTSTTTKQTKSTKLKSGAEAGNAGDKLTQKERAALAFRSGD